MIEACFTARLGRDAELKMVKGGSLAMCSFTAAVEDSQAADDAPATWVRVVTFGERAEELAPRLVKGVKAYVEGRLEVSLWTPEDGRTPRININVTASTIQPLGQIAKRRPRQQRRDLPTRGRSTRDATREPPATFGSSRDRDAYVAELAERFDRRPPDEVPW
jgi:single-strand DNA-binding protein